MGAKLLAPVEGWWPSATKWGPFGPPGQIQIHIQHKYKYKYIYSTNTNTYRVQVQIQHDFANSLWSSSSSSSSSSSTKSIYIGLDKQKILNSESKQYAQKHKINKENQQKKSWTCLIMRLFSFFQTPIFCADFCFINKLEGLAPYGGQTSSSCGRLVAFGHQMGALRAPWLVKLKFGALCTPPSSSCGGLMAFFHLIWAMFVYGFGCFFVLFIMGHPQEVSLKVL